MTDNPEPTITPPKELEVAFGKTYGVLVWAIDSFLQLMLKIMIEKEKMINTIEPLKMFFMLVFFDFNNYILS